MTGVVTTAKLSVTVLLLRVQGETDLEVLMQRRAAKMTFGGAWAFPGGSVEAADRRDAADEAGTLHNSVVRETWEETSIRLPNPDELVTWGRWITPVSELRRFDTWFYAVAAPPDQRAQPCGHESTALEWQTPQRMIAAAMCGERLVFPPTWVTLADLADSWARHSSLPAMLAAERHREILPLMPRVVGRAPAVNVLMPWDPAYTTGAGADAAPLARIPDHLCRLPSCFKRPGS